MVRLSECIKWTTLLLSLQTFWFMKPEQIIPVRRRPGGGGRWNVLGSVRARTVFQRDYNLLLVFKFSTSEQVSDQEQKTLSS